MPHPYTKILSRLSLFLGASQKSFAHDFDLRFQQSVEVVLRRTHDLSKLRGLDKAIGHVQGLTVDGRETDRGLDLHPIQDVSARMRDMI